MFEDSKVVDPAVLFPALAAAIDALTVRPDPATPAAVVRAQARALVVLTRRVQALLLGRLAVIDGQGLAEGDGMGSTVAWVRAFTNAGPAGARGLVDAARLADRLPSLGAVAAAGKVAPEHLAAFAAVTRDVPAEVVAGHEFTVTNLAPHARPADLRRLGEKIRDCHDQGRGHGQPGPPARAQAGEPGPDLPGRLGPARVVGPGGRGVGASRAGRLVGEAGAGGHPHRRPAPRRRPRPSRAAGPAFPRAAGRGRGPTPGHLPGPHRHHPHHHPAARCRHYWRRRAWRRRG